PAPIHHLPPSPTLFLSVATSLIHPVPQRPLFEKAFALFREAGTPLEPSIDALEGSPTDRDRRIALAMSEQLEHLSSRATTLHLRSEERRVGDGRQPVVA